MPQLIVGDLVRFSIAEFGKDMVGMISQGPTDSHIAKREGWLKTSRSGRGVKVRHLKSGEVFGKRQDVVRKLKKVRSSEQNS